MLKNIHSHVLYTYLIFLYILQCASQKKHNEHIFLTPFSIQFFSVSTSPPLCEENDLLVQRVLAK